jgi:hypothetical protein
VDQPILLGVSNTLLIPVTSIRPGRHLSKHPPRTGRHLMHGAFQRDKLRRGKRRNLRKNLSELLLSNVEIVSAL